MQLRIYKKGGHVIWDRFNHVQWLFVLLILVFILFYGGGALLILLVL
jgi:hypothetical protein